MIWLDMFKCVMLRDRREKIMEVALSTTLYLHVASVPSKKLRRVPLQKHFRGRVHGGQAGVALRRWER